MEQTVILAGGCFWGMQELLRRVPGVLSTRVGYCGGDTANATYRNHGRHAEAVEVRFDADRLGLRELLKVFFQIHDPTTRDRQGNDIGSSYRSAILYRSEEQRETARQLIARMDASGVWPGRIVTELKTAGAFWPAEPEHQDYLRRNPMGYTCHYPRPDWKLPEEA